MKHYIFFFCLFFSAYVFSQSDYTAKILLSDSGDSLRYQELIPENYDPGKKYPLVLFLHGAGERGTDNLSQLKHGSKMFTNPVNREKYPAFVIFPQCPKDHYWSFRSRPTDGKVSADVFPADYEISDMMKQIKNLLDLYSDKDQIDKDRIYVIGLSMGGMATFDLACRFPDLFAAVIPICGGVNPDRLAVCKNIKFRIYHGDADSVVPVENSRIAYTALKKAGASVEYTEFPGHDHDSWTPAFNKEDFLSWLFDQVKD